jgi:subtilase family serine protease
VQKKVSMASTHLPARKTLKLLALLTASVLPTALLVQTASAGQSPSRLALPGTSASWTAKARVVGTPSAKQAITFDMVLRLHNGARAKALASAVSNPKSARYGHYLSAARFNTRFAPRAAQVSKVESFLRSQGIKVNGVAQGNRWVSATGSVAQIQRAFATTLRTYAYHGRTLRASTGALSVPAALRPSLLGVLGVSQTASLRKPADALPTPSTCSTFWDQHEQTGPPAYGKTSFPTPNCGYTAQQMRGAYGLQSAENKGNTGKGVTVAIIDAYGSASMLSDSDALSASQGEPQLTKSTYTETLMQPFVNQTECGGEVGWNEEESLDVESVHAMAPGAKIHYVGASDCDTGIDTAVNYVIQNHVADIVSNSYGFAGEDGLGSEVATEDSMFVQAAVEGIGFYFSSGDDGDNTVIGAPHPEPDFPASDPWVTGVGGTSLAINSNNSYKFEAPWGNFIDPVNTATSPSSYTSPLPGSFLSGAGGGVSALFKEPIWQKLDVPKKLATLNGSTPMRVVPDIASDADPETGFLIEIQGQTVQIGGTSLACPTIAGVQALAEQGRRIPLGFATPSLYLLGLVPGVMHDVKAPASQLAMMTISGRTLISMGLDTSLTATKGYDDTTGLGTPNGSAYLLGERLIG